MALPVPRVFSCAAFALVFFSWYTLSCVLVDTSSSTASPSSPSTDSPCAQGKGHRGIWICVQTAPSPRPLPPLISSLGPLTLGQRRARRQSTVTHFYFLFLARVKLTHTPSTASLSLSVSYYTLVLTGRVICCTLCPLKRTFHLRVEWHKGTQSTFHCLWTA